ncbi:hypothetical protein E4L96_11890 [Massilia arenosa]|uniref:Peptidase A2 domain-containing protein n=1 Tax=Zemynaea arenosa TaxID=2561931 RepID=A0A4Y9SBA6_9BURK|nr:retroviral-like aspartic protease family protein [Massilia arenosa]TFW19326.1 hypothetical protein E4L96_11890 [Massilia arenosa]
MTITRAVLAPAVLAIAAIPTVARGEGCKYLTIAELPVTYTGAGLQPAVEGKINGKPAAMLIDTGSTWTLITPTAVGTYGLSQRASGEYVTGIGGRSRVYQSRVADFSIGPVTVHNRWLRVLGEMAGEPSYAAIIGSDFWMQADFELVLSEKKLRFFKPQSCDRTVFLGYWDQNAMVIPLEAPGQDPRPHVMVKVNGGEVQAVIDSGATYSVLSKAAASRIGLNPEELPLELSGFAQGAGADRVRSYRVRATVSIGDETIRHARLQVSSDSQSFGSGAEMLLGQDWLRAHRVLFASSQQKLYFTYNGIEPFEQTGEPWYAAEAQGGNADAQVLMGRREDTRKHPDDARAWFAKAAAQGNPRANEILAVRALAANRQDEAEAYLRATLAAQPANGQAALLLYTVQAAQQHQDAGAQTLRTWMEKAPRESWIRPVAQFYLGQASEQDALKSAGTDEDRVCTVHDLVARWHAVNKDAARAAAVRAAGQPACAAIKRGLL